MRSKRARDEKATRDIVAANVRARGVVTVGEGPHALTLTPPTWHADDEAQRLLEEQRWHTYRPRKDDSSSEEDEGAGDTAGASSGSAATVLPPTSCPGSLAA